MIVFREFVVHMPFRFLWLKYVTGTNLNVHCAGCLKGEYSERITKEPGIYHNIELDEQPAKVLYLCGVAKPYDWSRNFHLAMIERPGSEIGISEKNITVVAENAERLPIHPGAIERVGHSKRRLPRYHTCRNWQFANFLELSGLLGEKQ